MTSESLSGLFLYFNRSLNRMGSARESSSALAQSILKERFKVKKYRMMVSDSIKKASGEILYRIEAIRDFKLITGKKILKGDLGGYIEKPTNLSHYGNSWVAGEAMVFGEAKVIGNALVNDNAIVSGMSEIAGESHVSDNAQIIGSALRNSVKVRGNPSLKTVNYTIGFQLITKQKSLAPLSTDMSPLKTRHMSMEQILKGMTF